MSSPPGSNTFCRDTCGTRPKASKMFYRRLMEDIKFTGTRYWKKFTVNLSASDLMCLCEELPELFRTLASVY